MEPSFIHLRAHTEYSLIDGLVRIKPYIQEAVKQGMPALGITDQCNLFGVVKFYKAALGAGIKPVIGSDFWIANEEDEKNPFLITLFCQNNEGYHNLIILLTR